MASWPQAGSTNKEYGSFISVLQKYVLEHGGLDFYEFSVKELLVKNRGLSRVSEQKGLKMVQTIIVNTQILVLASGDLVPIQRYFHKNTIPLLD